MHRGKLLAVSSPKPVSRFPSSPLYYFRHFSYFRYFSRCSRVIWKCVSRTPCNTVANHQGASVLTRSIVSFGHLFALVTMTTRSLEQQTSRGYLLQHGADVLTNSPYFEKLGTIYGITLLSLTRIQKLLVKLCWTFMWADVEQKFKKHFYHCLESKYFKRQFT